ncbi:hypothetical protein BDV93DRAFT_604685 [Ceratobasidium sp. AG-I]|nr:hypothetical protein BDV93DRAFT_604685 [Ceratobasidium sp. AG-I]
MAIGQIRALPVLPTQPQPQAQSQPQPAQPTSNPSPIPTPSPSPRPYPRPLPNLPTPTNSSNPLPTLPNTTPNLPPPDRVLSPAPTTSSSISSASAYHSGHKHGASSVSDLSYFRDKDTTEHGEIVPGPGSDAVFGSGSGSGKEGGVPQVKVHEPATSTATTNTNTSAASTASTSVSTATTTTATPSSPSPTQTGSPSLVSRLGKKKRQLSRDLLRLPSPAPALPSTIPIGDFPQMIAQHHMQTMGLHSPPPSSSSSSGWKDKDPQTPTRPGRLNLGMFSSRARKESASASSSVVGVGGRRPSTPSASMLDMGARSDISRNAGEGFGFGDTHDGDGSLKRRGSGSASGSPSTHAGLTALFNGGRVSPHSPASSTLASPPQNQPSSGQPRTAASPKAKVKPITPPKPSKFKAGNILGTALGMGVGGRGSVGIMPSSP